MTKKENKTHINWYPGHMTKAKRMMQDNIKLIDLLIELVDARAPLSTRNPDLDEMGKNKSRLILLNKADMADEALNAAWCTWFEEQGFYALQIDSRNKNGMKKVSSVIAKACEEKTNRDRKRGILNRPVRAMVVGIPNVGKSTFINSFAGKACTKTGNKPGVTRGAQWIRLNKQVELLDTPGILWPKIEDPEAGLRMAAIGSIKDDILDVQELSLELITFLAKHYGDLLKERYKITLKEKNYEILADIAVARGCIQKGNEPDMMKASRLLLDDFRSGRLGKITLEIPTVCE